MCLRADLCFDAGLRLGLLDIPADLSQPFHSSQVQVHFDLTRKVSVKIVCNVSCNR